jgi:SAM-dependent methyltransferase
MWDPVWEDIFACREWGKYPSEDLIRFVARNFYQASDRFAVRLLEVGCGPGANLWYLAREGFSFVGIDGSPTAIGKAASRLDAECPGWRARGELRVGDIASLPYEPASFDGVIDNEAVYCNSFDISRDIYADIARVLKPGGRLYSRTFATGSWGDGTGESVGKRTWRCTEGPLAGKGVSRFTAEEDIPVLLAPFDIDTLELLSWTFDSRQQQVREWIITAHSR